MSPYEISMLDSLFQEAEYEILHVWNVSRLAKPAVVLAAGILHFLTITPDEIIREGSFTRMGDVQIKQ